MADLIAHAVVIGIGATMVMDLWTFSLRLFFGITPLDYALVGRWLGHFRYGRFAHPNIRSAAPIRGEPVLGWTAHYLTGIVFAFLLLLMWGLEWAQQPTLPPALAIGLGTIIIPFFIMQPAFGMGIAGANMPNPVQSRLRSLATHTAFSVGLYATAWLWAVLGQAFSS